jgi:glyoxylase-like metal-dependent hydrolase (beta-lactamase superfamily II)
VKPEIYERSSVGSNRLETPPDTDEVEVSVFGPGYGESILVHAGENNWLIVDSCIDPARKEPAPLTYLNQIEVNPKTAVKQVIATHWHDDHVRGLGDIYKTCSSAEFVCSMALNSQEFLELVTSYGHNVVMESSGVGEFSKYPA